MKTSVVVALALLSAVNAKFSGQSDSVNHFMWEEFKQEFHKSYRNSLDERRHFEAFIENLKIIDERNQKERDVGGSGMHGLTKFCDLTQEEFAARYLKTEKPETLPDIPKVSLKPMGSVQADWTGVYTTPVKDQGYCGSCWAFSVTEQLESDSMRQLGTDFIMAPQELVSCDTSDSGCNGGWPTNAYQWIEGEGGLVAETDYPYTSGQAGVTGTCNNSNLNDKLITVTNYYQLSDESSMAAHCGATGPIAIAVDASEWSTYTGGILTSCGTSIDHAVQIVGIDTDAGYWKIRNSWGTSWGESGYIRVAYGADTCGLTTIPTYVDTASA